MNFFITSLFYQIRTFAFTKCFCIFIIGIHVALSLFWLSDYSCLLKYKYGTSIPEIKIFKILCFTPVIKRMSSNYNCTRSHKVKGSIIHVNWTNFYCNGSVLLSNILQHLSRQKLQIRHIRIFDRSTFLCISPLQPAQLCQCW